MLKRKIYLLLFFRLAIEWKCIKSDWKRRDELKLENGRMKFFFFGKAIEIKNIEVVQSYNHHIKHSLSVQSFNLDRKLLLKRDSPLKNQILFTLQASLWSLFSARNGPYHWSRRHHTAKSTCKKSVWMDIENSSIAEYIHSITHIFFSFSLFGDNSSVRPNPTASSWNSWWHVARIKRQKLNRTEDPFP